MRKIHQQISSFAKLYYQNYSQGTTKLYSESNLLKLNNVFKLEVIKYVYKLVKKTFPKYFVNCFLFSFHILSDTHIYTTSFANDKYWSSISFKCSKSFTQKSIKHKELQTLE